MLAFALFFLSLGTAYASTSYMRSETLKKGWESSKCQNYLDLGYFSTIEDHNSCGKDHLPCPKPVPSELLVDSNYRWKCSSEKHELFERPALISHEHRFIFMHVPKAATSSLVHLLGKEFEPFTRDSISSLTSIKEEDFSSYFVFTFVRDPLMKLESSISESRRVYELFRIMKISAKSTLNHISNGCKVNDHLISMAKYLKVTNPYSGEEIKYDFIGSLENFKEDYEYLLNILKKPFNERVLVDVESSDDSKNTHSCKKNQRLSRFSSELDYQNPKIKEDICRMIRQDNICFPSIRSNHIDCEE